MSVHFRNNRAGSQTTIYFRSRLAMKEYGEE